MFLFFNKNVNFLWFFFVIELSTNDNINIVMPPKHHSSSNIIEKISDKMKNVLYQILSIVIQSWYANTWIADKLSKFKAYLGGSSFFLDLVYCWQ